MADLDNQVVLITGCSSGIGRALAEEFARRGHRFLATARSRDSIEELASDRIRTARLDVTDPESIDRAVTECTTWAGRIDMVVNNAGYAFIGPVAELDLGELRTQFETNVVGVVAVTQAVVSQMVDRRCGRIVNIGSVSGVTATPFGGVFNLRRYCGSGDRRTNDRGTSAGLDPDRQRLPPDAGDRAASVAYPRSDLQQTLWPRPNLKMKKPEPLVRLGSL